VYSIFVVEVYIHYIIVVSYTFQAILICKIIKFANSQATIVSSSADRRKDINIFVD